MEAKDRKKARNDSYYIRTQNARLLKEPIKSIIKGIIPIEKFLKKYAWKELEINKIRALDSTFRLILEDKHSVFLEDIYKNKTVQPPIRIADVQEVCTPAPTPRPDNPQGLEETTARVSIPLYHGGKLMPFGLEMSKSIPWVQIQKCQS